VREPRLMTALRCTPRAHQFQFCSVAGRCSGMYRTEGPLRAGAATRRGRQQRLCLGLAALASSALRFGAAGCHAVASGRTLCSPPFAALRNQLPWAWAARALRRERPRRRPRFHCRPRRRTRCRPAGPCPSPAWAPLRRSASETQGHQQEAPVCRVADVPSCVRLPTGCHG
jgi:hypothetical protein